MKLTKKQRSEKRERVFQELADTKAKQSMLADIRQAIAIVWSFASLDTTKLVADGKACWRWQAPANEVDPSLAERQAQELAIVREALCRMESRKRFPDSGRFWTLFDRPQAPAEQFAFDGKTGRWVYRQTLPVCEETKKANFARILQEQKDKQRDGTAQWVKKESKPLPDKLRGILARKIARLIERHDIGLDLSQEQIDRIREAYLKEKRKRHLRLARVLFWKAQIQAHENLLPSAKKTIVYLGRFDRSGAWVDETHSSLRTGKKRGRLKVYRRGHCLPVLRGTSMPLADRLSPSADDRELLLKLETMLGMRLSSKLTTSLIQQESRLTPATIRSLAESAKLQTKTVLCRFRKALQTIEQSLPVFGPFPLG